MKRRYSVLFFSAAFAAVSLVAVAAEPVRIESVRLADGDMAVAADNSRFAFMSGSKSGANKRSVIEKISDKLETSRRVRESKKMAREQKQADAENARRRGQDDIQGASQPKP